MTDWRERITVPRAPFIPPVVWVDDAATGGFSAVSRDDDHVRWHELVEADEPIITQVDDGRTPPGATGLRPSSSCSKPSLVADMLDALDVRLGHRVLEIGGGTGWNAAELATRVGPRGQIVSIEVDPDVAAAERQALRTGGYDVVVITADGLAGHAREAPYDRVIGTAAVRAIPRAWIDQAHPRGVIVTPWGTDYCNGTLLRLDVHDDGSASGRCGTNLAFMRVRGQRRDYLEPGDDELRGADRTTTARSIPEFFEMIAYSRAAFAIGLRVPRCYLTVEELAPDHRRIELHDVSSRSWARVDLLRRNEIFEVHQIGPRRLWEEVDAAYGWWLDSGRPAPDRFGLTVAENGDHSAWLDEPGEASWPLPVAAP
ncbi:methyltransferase domain-containing protein [Saccharopolyspora shandongensis]|uniref:Protein-L-isoaspartate O-methyltransferase n=1 Tax=Saccharopolyspora shandongensis TaxID=418495 RepID=A0A1H3PHI3_9PSEU|nr:methyltransferase domain-containing protein [Saccharopolyspora shandongensis]SDZ00590.1 protein-L-isoaspartate(D-aspartate) O-methyltransferase [Saccharopolyspora shandongensis]